VRAKVGNAVNAAIECRIKHESAIFAAARQTVSAQTAIELVVSVAKPIDGVFVLAAAELADVPVRVGASGGGGALGGGAAPRS
jgi:hypothetical protein